MSKVKHKEWILWVKEPWAMIPKNCKFQWTPFVGIFDIGKHSPEQFLEHYVKLAFPCDLPRNTFKILPASQRPQATKNISVKEPRL